MTSATCRTLLAQRANLKEFDTIYVRQPLTAREKMIRRLNRFLTGILSELKGHTLLPAVQIYEKFGSDLKQVLELNDPKGIYAYCLMCNVD